MADHLHEFLNDFLDTFSGRARLDRIEAELCKLTKWADTIPTRKDLRHLEERMAAREDASYEKLNADIESVKTGWAALQAQNAALAADNQTLRDALAAADADKAAAVESALTADSETDADKIDAADAALASLLPVEPPAEEPTEG